MAKNRAPKALCHACGTLFPDAEVCPTCKWRQEDEPTETQQILYTLRRLARDIATLRYYAWSDRPDSDR